MLSKNKEKKQKQEVYGIYTWCTALSNARKEAIFTRALNNPQSFYWQQGRYWDEEQLKYKLLGASQDLCSPILHTPWLALPSISHRQFEVWEPPQYHSPAVTASRKKSMWGISLAKSQQHSTKTASSDARKYYTMTISQLLLAGHEGKVFGWKQRIIAWLRLKGT